MNTFLSVLLAWATISLIKIGIAIALCASLLWSVEEAFRLIFSF